MPPKLQVHFLPALLRPRQIEDGLVVVIDVLRASTTICHALAAGALAVVPCQEVDEARGLAAGFAAGDVVLGGERDGLRIEGFDLGNSPEDYTPHTVGRKTVVFTTTNGAKAVTHCRPAARVLIGAFVNLSAIVRACGESLRGGPAVHLLCSGTQGEITCEDVWFAGAVTAGLLGEAGDREQAEAPMEDRKSPSMNDEARLAVAAWITHGAGFDHQRFADALLVQTQGGRNLQRQGLQRDVRAAAEVDRFDFTPELDLAKWSIART